jgi:hypothetical protein
LRRDGVARYKIDCSHWSSNCWPFCARGGCRPLEDFHEASCTVQETVIVTGESPVIDTPATRVQQNVK